MTAREPTAASESAFPGDGPPKARLEAVRAAWRTGFAGKDRYSRDLALLDELSAEVQRILRSMERRLGAIDAEVNRIGAEHRAYLGEKLHADIDLNSPASAFRAARSRCRLLPRFWMGAPTTPMHGGAARVRSSVASKKRSFASSRRARPGEPSASERATITRARNATTAARAGER